MSTYQTLNPLGSTDPKDLYDNAEGMDQALNGLASYWVDRFGMSRKSWRGLESDVVAFFANNGYETPVNYVAGLTMTRYGQTVVYLGELYAPLVAALPFTTTTWATDSVKFKAIGDASLRAALAASDGSKKSGYKARNVYDRLADHSSVKDFPNVVPDGVTDNLSAINAAFAGAVGRELYLPEGDYYCSAWPLNNRGIKVTGPGRILLTTPNGKWQINTYASATGIGVHFEHLFKPYQRLKAGGQMKIMLFGDSTVAGHNGENPDYYVENLIGQTMASKGLTNVVVQNFGVAGSNTSAIDVASRIDTTISASCDIAVIKSGINDPHNLITLYNSLDTVVGNARNTTNGSVQQLAIVLMLPTSTYDIAHDRSSTWYEQVRGVYVAIAEKHRCAVFDSYKFLQDTSAAEGFWQDMPFGAGGGSVHMLDVGNNWIWNKLIQWMFPTEMLSLYAKNRVIFGGAASGSPAPGAAIGSYNFGISNYRAISTAGWPQDGFVTTERTVDGGGRQTIYGFANNVTPMTRYWLTASNTWSVWTNMAQALSGFFAADIAAPSGTRRAAGYRVSDSSRLELCGSIQVNAAKAVGDVIFNALPTRCRPTKGDSVFFASGSGGGVQLLINASGIIYAQSAIAAGTIISLDNCSVMVD